MGILKEMSKYVYIYIYIHTDIHTYKYIYIYVCLYAYTHIHIHMYMYIYALDQKFLQPENLKPHKPALSSAPAIGLGII